MTEAAASSPTYDSAHKGRMSEYACHQPRAFASLARLSSAARSSASVTPYKVSRSATSRALKPTRPCSIRLILECEPRIASAACSAVMPRDSRSRCSWLPSTRRWTVRPPERVPKMLGGTSQAESSDETIGTPRIVAPWILAGVWTSLPCDLALTEGGYVTIQKM